MINYYNIRKLNRTYYKVYFEDCTDQEAIASCVESGFEVVRIDHFRRITECLCRKGKKNE